MCLLSIVIITVLAAILCYKEIPSMLKSKHFIDLWAFILLLASGVILIILKALKVKLPNPSDIYLYLFSPLSDVLSKFFYL